MKLLRRIIIIPIVAILAFTMVNTGPFGDGITESKAATKSELKKDLSNVKAEKKDAKDEYAEKRAAEKKLEEQIVSVESKIQTTQSKLNSLESKIKTTVKSIEKVENEIEVKEAELAQQNKDLGERLRLMYESGDASMVEVLLGSESFVDFMSNLEMVQLIHEYDMKVLNEIDKKLQEIEDKKKELDALKASLKSQKEEQQAKRDSLAADKKTLAKAEEAAHKDTLEAWAAVEALEKESSSIERRLQAMQSSGQLSTAKYTGGRFGWPANGSISSRYGYRVHPTLGTRRMHTGLDIAVPSGSPVRAAGDGTVISAKWDGSYGNAVMIDHGSNIVTLYAHNSSFTVSVGTKVKRGQQIAKAGSTGRSTGPHCHFEVRVNGVHQNPLNWL